MDNTFRENWEVLVGRFILICGDIELALLQLHLNMHIENEDFESVRNSNFIDKVKKINKALETNNIPFKTNGKIRKLLSKITNLAPKRNLIAHNPLFLDAFEKENQYTFERKIYSLRDESKHITLSGLEKEILNAQKISNELFEIMAYDFTK